ncbi:BppU family phage baseplate upper protein [Bacillus cereus]|uniref:BppU family phage baseplate upper protein n=1 Tax=Bacillus cereus TaxID=1396 RepID=UPI003D95D969
MIQRQPTFKFDLTHPSPQPKVFQRLGEKQATDIIVQILNGGQPFSLTGIRFGFEMRNDAGKIIIDENQTKFSVIDNAKGIFRYRVDDAGFGYFGNSYLAYFTLKISDVRITTERFRFHNDEDVQLGATGLQEHYVSVIDDLVKSNAEALQKAQEIKAMIEANQVVKKTGDTLTGPINFDAAFTVRGAGATYDMRPQISGAYQKGYRHTVNTSNNFYAIAPIDASGAANWTNQVALYGDTGVLEVLDIKVRGGTNSDVVSKKNDGRATLTLTSDAVNFATNRPLIADRRGNTVTVRGAVGLKSDAVGNLISTLPTAMRPTTDIPMMVLATDGTHLSIDIMQDGRINFWTKGKNVYLAFTYTVN